MPLLDAGSSPGSLIVVAVDGSNLRIYLRFPVVIWGS